MAKITNWIETGGAQSQANSKGINQSVAPKPMNNVYEKPTLMELLAHPYAVIGAAQDILQRDYESNRTRTYALPSGFAALKKERKETAWIETGGAQSQANSLGINQSIPASTPDIDVEQYLYEVYGDMKIDDLADEIERLRDVPKPYDTLAWEKADSKEEVALEHEYQEHLVMLGMLEVMLDKKILVRDAMQQLLRDNIRINNFAIKAGDAVILQVERDLGARDVAYRNWFEAADWPKGATAEDILGPISLEWFQEYNRLHNKNLPIPDELLQFLQPKNALYYDNTYSPNDGIGNYINSEFNRRYGDIITKASEAANAEYTAAIQINPEFHAETNLAITAAAETAAKRIAVDSTDPHQINSPVDVGTNAVFRSNVGQMDLFLQNMPHEGESKDPFAKDSKWHTRKSSIMSAYAATQGQLDQGSILWTPEQEKYVSLALTGQGNSDFADVTEEELYAFMYEEIWKKYGVTPEQTAEIITATRQDPWYGTKEMGKELLTLLDDKFYDPMMLGRVDLILTNTLYSVGEVMDLTSYHIKMAVADAAPQLFGKEKTTEEIQQGTFAPTFSESGRVNPNYNTGNFAADLVLEIFSDFTTWMNLGATIGRRVSAQGMAKKVGQTLEDSKFWKTNPLQKQTIIEALTKPAFGFSKPGRTTLAKSLAAGKPLQEAIPIAFGHSDELTDILKAMPEKQQARLFKILFKTEGTELGYKVIQGLMTVDAIADGIDAALLKTALTFSGPGIPLLALKGVSEAVKLSQARRMRLHNAYANEKTKLVSVADFIKYAIAQIEAQKALPIEQQTDITMELFEQFKASVAFDLHKLFKLRAKFDAGEGNLHKVLEEIQDFIISKTPGIEKGIVTPRTVKELVQAYRENVLEQFQKLAELGVKAEQIPVLKNAWNADMLQFEAILHNYTRVSDVIIEIDKTVGKRVQHIEKQLGTISDTRATLVKSSWESSNFAEAAFDIAEEDVKEFGLFDWLASTVEETSWVEVHNSSDFKEVIDQFTDRLLKIDGVTYTTPEGVKKVGTLKKALNVMGNRSGHKHVNVKEFVRNSTRRQFSEMYHKVSEDLTSHLNRVNTLRAKQGLSALTLGDLSFSDVRAIFNARIQEMFQQFPQRLINQYAEIFPAGSLMEINDAKQAIMALISPAVKQRSNIPLEKQLFEWLLQTAGQSWWTDAAAPEILEEIIARFTNRILTLDGFSFVLPNGKPIKGSLQKVLEALRKLPGDYENLFPAAALVGIGQDAAKQASVEEIVREVITDRLKQLQQEIAKLPIRENTSFGTARMMVRPKLRRMFDDLPDAVITRYTENIYADLQKIKDNSLRWLEEVSNRTEISSVIKESKYSLETLFAQKPKHGDSWAVLTDIEKQGASREIAKELITKYAQNSANQLIATKGAAQRVKGIKNRFQKLIERYKGVTGFTSEEVTQSSFFEFVQKLNEDFQNVVLAGGGQPQTTATLAHSLQNFFSRLEQFLIDVENIKHNPHAYADLVKERELLLKQLDRVKKIQDKLTVDLFDKPVRAVIKGEAIKVAQPPTTKFRTLDDVEKDFLKTEPSFTTKWDKRFKRKGHDWEKYQLLERTKAERIEKAREKFFLKEWEKMKAAYSPSMGISRDEYYAQIAGTFYPAYKTESGEWVNVIFSDAAFATRNSQSEAYREQLTRLTKKMQEDPDMHFHEEVITDPGYLKLQRQTKQTKKGKQVSEQYTYAPDAFTTGNTHPLMDLHSFLDDIQKELEHRTFDNLIKEQEVIAFEDTIYRLKKENLFNHVALNYTSGWMQIVDTLLYDNVAGKSSLLERIISDPDFITKFPDAPAEQIQELAREIHHYAVASRHTHDMEQEILTMLTGLGPVKLFNSDVEATEVAHAFLSNLQQFSTRNLTLEELFYGSSKYVDEAADNAELYLSTSNKFPKLKLDDFRELPAFQQWVKDSKYGALYDLMFTKAHTGESDTLLGLALFDYLSDPVNAKKHFPGEFKLDLPIDRRNTWYLDWETTGSDPMKAGITSGTLRNVDNPDLTVTVYVRNPVEPLPPVIAEKTFGSVDEYNRLIATSPNVVENERIAVQQMYTFMKENSTVPMEHVRIMTHNGDKFDLRMGARFLPSQRDFWFSKKHIDTLRMMRKANGYFEFGLEVRNNLKVIFRRYIEKLRGIQGFSGLRTKFIMGATPDLAQRIRQFADLLESAEMNHIVATNGYLNFMEDLRNVANEISQQAADISMTNKLFKPTFIARSDIEEFGGINAILKDAGANMEYSTKAAYKSEYMEPFFEGYADVKLTPSEAPLLGRISYYADSFAKKVKPNKFYQDYDFSEVIKQIKARGSKSEPINKFIQFLRVENTASNHFAIIRQLAYWEPGLKEVLPREILAILADPKLFYQELPTAAFDALMKNIGSPKELVEAFDLLKANAEDPLGMFAKKMDISNRYLFSPEMRVHGAGIVDARRLVEMAMEKYAEIPEFARHEKQLHDIMMSAYMKELFAIPVENGQLTEAGLDKLISHMLYNARTPVIRISTNGLFVDTEFEEFVKLLKQSPELLERRGIAFHQDSFALYLGLTEAPGKNITQDLSKFTYRGNVVERPEFYGGFFSEFDMASTGIKELDGYAQQLNKVNDKLLQGTQHNYFQKLTVHDPATGKAKNQWFQMSQGTGAMKEVVNTAEIEEIFTGMLPAEVQAMFPSPALFLGDDMHSGITFNHFNLGSFESRKVLQPALSDSYASRLALSAKRVQTFGEAKYRMLSVFTDTDASLHLGFEGQLSDTFKRMFGIKGNPTKADYAKIQEYLKTHPEFTLAAVVEDKKMGFRLIQIRPNSPKLVEEAIRLNAIVVENNVFAYLFNKINYNNIGEKAPLLVRMFQEGSKAYMVLSKLGWLSRSATYLNNIVDNSLKSMLDAGQDVITSSMYQATAAIEYTQFNKILRHLDTGGLSFDDAITIYFRHTKDLPMSEARFRELYEVLDSFGSAKRTLSSHIRLTQASKGAEKVSQGVQTALTIGFMPMSFPEGIARLAHYNALATQGVETHEAIRRVLQTFFDYSHGIHGAMDFLFPFYNFMTNNLVYWMQKIDTHPAFFKLISNYAPALMDESQMTAVDAVESPQRNWARGLLHVPLSLFTDGVMSGSYLALNSSFMDIFKFGANPLQFLEDNMFEGSRQLLQTMKYAVNNPELVKAGNIVELWTAAQQTYSGHSFLLGGRDTVQPDEVQMEHVWNNFQKLIPIYGAIQGAIDRSDRIYRRTGERVIPSLINTPYHARVTDIFPLGMDNVVMREYAYLNNAGQPVSYEYVKMTKDPDETKETHPYDPTRPFRITKTTEGTKYEILDVRTGEAVYTAIYPTQEAGEFFNRKNMDGTQTSYLRDAKGDVVWSRTTEASTVYGDFTTTQTTRDVKTGQLVGIRVYLPEATYVQEEVDAIGRRIQYRYNADLELMGTTRIHETARGTEYAYYDSNGIFQNMNFYRREDLTFDEKDLGNGRFALVAYDSKGYAQFVQYYTVDKFDLNGTEVTRKNYENIDFKDVQYQYQYYDQESQERITLSQSMGGLKNGSTARKTEKYDPKTNTITVVYYNKFDNVIRTEQKSVKFNYLNYKPGGYSCTYKQTFYDPKTGVLQTNYVDSNDKIKYYKKVISTAEGKYYEYYDANGNLTSQTFYSSEPRSLREEKSFDIENNIKIFSYYDEDGNLQYTKKIIADYNPDHLGKVYEYYDADGNLTKSTFYSAFTNNSTADPEVPGQATRINSMDEIERLHYERSLAIREREEYLDTHQGSDEPESLETDEEYLEQLNAKIATLSAQLGRFPVQQTQQKKTSPGQAQTGQGGKKYNSTTRQYGRIQSAASSPNKAGLMVSRIRGMVSSKSPSSIYVPKDMNGLYFTPPSFYQKLYTASGSSRIMQNVNTVLHRHQALRMTQKMLQRLR